MRRPLAALALAFLLTTAGCSALTDLGGTDGTPTPSEVTAPGTADGQLTNRTVLLEAHRTALVETGFETTVQVNATAERQTRQGTQLATVERDQRTTVVREGAGYTLQLVNAGSGAQFDEWANESVRATRLQASGQTRYRTGPPRQTNRLTGTRFVQSYLDGNLTVESVEETDGEPRVTLTSTTPPAAQTAFPKNATDVRNYEARLVVDGEGRIRSLVVTADYTIRGEDAGLRVEYELVRTGVDAVDRPGWVENATQQ
jgi:hypothetical protein